jgi:hypothetical protein
MKSALLIHTSPPKVTVQQFATPHVGCLEPNALHHSVQTSMPSVEGGNHDQEAGSMEGVQSPCHIDQPESAINNSVALDTSEPSSHSPSSYVSCADKGHRDSTAVRSTVYNEQDDLDSLSMTRHLPGSVSIPSSNQMPRTNIGSGCEGFYLDLFHDKGKCQD